MNIDPRTEAAFDKAAEETDKRIAMYALTCANLNMCYQEIPSQRIINAFQEVWDKGVELTGAIEFYFAVQQAEKGLQP